MTDLAETYAALQKADAAGDTAGAKQLADYIRTQGSASQDTDDTPAAPQGPPGIGGYAAGVGETALQLGTGLIAQPVAGLSGLGTMAGRALGLTDADPADVVRSVQSSMTYEPKTQAGQSISNIVGYLPQKIAGAADWAGQKVSDVTGSPLAGAGVNTALQSLPLLVGAKLAGGGARAAAGISPEVANATSLGLKLTPTQAKGGFAARAIESMSGTAKLERSISGSNTPVINSIAKEELGIPQTSDLNAANIQLANKPAHAVMDAVKNTGNVTMDDTYQADIAGIQPPQQAGALPINSGIGALQERYGSVMGDDAGNLVNHIRQLRADASDNIKAPMEPDKNALGRAQLKVANALEGQLDRHIQAGAFQGPTGQIAPDLISQYRAARVQIAKSHTILDSLDGTNLDIADLGKRLERGAYMDGRLRQLAVAGQNYPRAAQVPSAIRSDGPFTGLGPYALAASVVHPAALAAVVGPPLARAALASSRYQRYGVQGLRQAPAIPGIMGTRTAFPLLTSGQQNVLTEDQQSYGLPSPAYITQ